MDDAVEGDAGHDVDEETVQECVSIVRSQNKKVRVVAILLFRLMNANTELSLF